MQRQSLIALSILLTSLCLNAEMAQPAWADSSDSSKSEHSEPVPSGFVISAETLKKYKPITITVEEEGKKSTYSGVPMRALLAEALPEIDTMTEWKKLARRQLIMRFTAEDGFPALFAATEVATNKAGDRFLLATECDGKPIDSGIRLVCPKDNHHVRWAKQIKSLQFISLVGQ